TVRLRLSYSNFIARQRFLSRLELVGRQLLDGVCDMGRPHDVVAREGTLCAMSRVGASHVTVHHLHQVPHRTPPQVVRGDAQPGSPHSLLPWLAEPAHPHATLMKDEGAIEPPYGPAPLDDFCQVRHQRDH